MEPALTILAAIGLIAVAWRFFRALFRLLRRGADAFLAREAADARANRGDLTGMAEAESRAAGARRKRRRVLLELGFWLALLLVPLWTPWTKALYAMAAVFWFFLRGWEEKRRRPGSGRADRAT